MKKLNVMFKKALAGILTFSIILSLFSAMLSIASAVSSDDFTISYDKNDVSGKVGVTSGGATIHFVDEAKSESKPLSLTSAYKMNDGDFSTEFFAGDGTTEYFDLAAGANIKDKDYASIGEWHISGDRYLQLTLPIKANAKIENIAVVHHSNSLLRMGDFEIFAANSAANLYKSENSISRIDNTSSKEAHVISFKEGKELQNIAFVGMRIYNPVTANSEAALGSFVKGSGISAIYPRMMEFNVYGEIPEADFEITQSNTAAIPSGLGDSVVKSVEMDFIRNGATVFSSVSLSQIYDSDASTTVGMLYNDGKCSYLDANEKPYDSAYAQFTYTILDGAKINDFVAVNHSNANLITGAYTLYFSNNKSTLFSSPQKIYKFENSSNTITQQISPKESLEYKYAGIRILSPVKDLQNYISATGHDYTFCVPRIYEMNFYGEIAKLGAGDVDAGKTIPSGTNILLGNTDVSVRSVDTVTNESKVVATNGTKLTDGDTSLNWDLGEGNGYFVRKNSETGVFEAIRDGSVYTDISYIFGGTATVDKIYLAFHASAALRAKRYAVYAAKDENDIFSDESLVEVIDNQGHFANVIELEETLRGIRGVGIRIYDPCYDYTASACKLDQDSLKENPNKHNIYPRISEIAVIGSLEKDPVPFSKVLNSVSAKLPEGVDLSTSSNLSAYWDPMFNFTQEDKGTSSKIASAKAATLADGNLENEVALSAHFADWDEENQVGIYHNEDGSRYLDIIYDLKTISKIDYIVFANHSLPALTTGKYSVFMANKESELFSGEPYVTVDNAAGYKAGKQNRVNVICFEKGKQDEARYVAIRIYNPVCDAKDKVVKLDEKNNFVYPRIMECAIYGSFVDPDFDPSTIKKPTSTADVDLEDYMSSHGESLIKGQPVYSYVDGRKLVSSGTWYTYVREITDNGDGSYHRDLSGMGNYEPGKSVVDFYWKLDTDLDASKVKGFIYQGISTAYSAPYFTSRYQVFVAEESEDLWQDETMVYDFDAENEGNMMGVVHEYGKDAPIGNYIGLRIINPVFSATEQIYPRLSLFYVWGEDTMIPGVPANLAENMPITPSFVTEDKKVEVKESNLTADETAKLTDSDVKTSAKIDTNAKNRDTLEITYNLCGDMKIDDIWVSALINKERGFSKMKVYSADTLAEVNDEASLLWTYKVGAKTGNIKPKKTFKKQLKARYLRFVFEDTKDSVVLNEIYINGLDNQKMKTRNLTAAMDPSSMEFIRTDLKTGAEKYISVSNNDMLFLIDGEITNYLTLYDGSKLGEVKYDILLHLGDLRTISNLKLNLLRNLEEFQPTKLNIYIGEIYDDVWGKSAKPDFKLKSSDFKNAVWEKQLRPMLGRFVRIELLDFAENEVYKQDDGSQLIVTTIADLRITGTKVVGLQTSDESEVISKVYNKDKSIGVSIDRLDINDIYTDVVSLRVTPEKATNWQMSTLNKNPYLKVENNKTVYKLELLDLYGNPVKDLGGRKLHVHFKVPKGEEMLYMIGDAGERAKMTALDTFFSEGECVAEFSLRTEGDNKVALLKMTTSDDEYWSTIGELEDFPEANEDDLYEKIDGESIVTEDRRFVVSSMYVPFESGVKFTATDVSLTASDSEYYDALYFYPDKKVAVFYDLAFELSNLPYVAENNSYDVSYYIPEFVSRGFSDLQVICVEDGMVYDTGALEEDGKLKFTINGAGRYAIIGNVSEDYIGVSPETGDSLDEVIAAFSMLLAAMYVALSFSKRKETDN